MSLKFLTRFRDRDRPTSKSKPCPPLPTSMSFDSHKPISSEVQIISWDSRRLEAEGRDVLISSRGRTPSEAVTPVYAAFTSTRLERARTNVSEVEIPTSKSSFAASPSFGSVMNRPRTAPRREPTSPLLDLRKTRSIVNPNESVEELGPNTPTKNSGMGSIPFTHRSRFVRVFKTDSMHKSGHSSEASSSSSYSIPRTGSLQSLTSLLSLHNEVGNLERSETKSKSSLMKKKPSMRRLRRKETSESSSGTSAVADEETPQMPPPQRRARSNSLTSLTSKILRQKDSKTDNSRPQSGKEKGSTRAPSSWRPDAVSSADGGFYASSACSSELELGGHLSQSASSHGHHSHSVSRENLSIPGSTHRASPPKSNEVHHNAALPASKRGSVVQARSKEIPVDAFTVPKSPMQALGSPQVSRTPLVDTSESSSRTASLSNLKMTVLFKQLGPPPFGLDSECFHERVMMIAAYMEGKVPSQESLDGTGLGIRTGMAGSPNVGMTSRRVAIADEFDKLECQMEQEMLKLILTKGEELRVAIDELRLEEVFLTARRQCDVDSSRTHFQLSDVNVMTSSPSLIHDARFLPDTGFHSSSSPSSVSSSNQMTATDHHHLRVDTLGGLNVSLRPAPRSKRRPTTAPEPPKNGSLPLSPKLSRDRLLPTTDHLTRPSTSRITRSPALSHRSFQTQASEDESHTLASVPLETAELHGNASSAPISAAHPPASGTPPGLFTPQSFSSKPPSAWGSTSYASTSLASSSSAPPSAFAIGSRRGSSDRESSSSHTNTTRSGGVRSPFSSTGGSAPTRSSVGTRDSHEACDTALQPRLYLQTESPAAQVHKL